MKLRGFLFLVAALIFTGCSDMNSQDNKSGEKLTTFSNDRETAYFAGGDSRLLEQPFEQIDGVISVITGYAGKNPEGVTFNEVEKGKDDIRFAIKIEFDPALISYSELLDIYWHETDPANPGGMFNNNGKVYTPAIYYTDERQHKLATEAKNLIAGSIQKKEIVTEVLPFENFEEADEQYQDYYKKSPDKFKTLLTVSGKEKILSKIWGERVSREYDRPADSEIRESLNPEQFRVTQEQATEKPFKNEFWDNKKEGIYVDVVSGEPLFSSKDKFDSGTGWPCFTKPLEPEFVKKKVDNSHFMERIEVRSKHGDSHLGHVFYEGNKPTNLRYCINSASLKFIPKEKMAEAGYSAYLYIFNEKKSVK